MKRFFTVLEGNEKGLAKPFEPGADYMLVGRSGDAGIKIEDPKVSRGHLEVRIKAGAAFVKNLSPFGFKHNGELRTGEDEVKLKPGDVLTLGTTKLRYDETASGPAGPDRTEERLDDQMPEEGETRAADEDMIQGRLGRGMGGSQEGDSSDTGGTRGPRLEETRPLPSGDVPDWEPPKDPRTLGGARKWRVLAGLLCLLAAGVWLWRGSQNASETGTVEFRDPLRGFGIEYPAGWSKLDGGPDLISFGVGREVATGGQDWMRLNIHSDKQPQNADTGLTFGFEQYKGVLRNRFQGFQFSGSKFMRVNEAAVIYFGFVAANLEGIGIYLLDGDTRLAVECYCPAARYQEHKQSFVSVLQSFHRISAGAQQYIDFPLPDDQARRMAMVSPTEASRQIEEGSRRGDDFLAKKDVRPDNLHRSLEAYRKAMQLQLTMTGAAPANPDPALARKLRVATQAYNQAIAQQQFEIKRARKLGRVADAVTAAHRLMQIVPEKTDPIYQEASRIVRALTPNREQR